MRPVDALVPIGQHPLWRHSAGWGAAFKAGLASLWLLVATLTPAAEPVPNSEPPPVSPAFELHIDADDPMARDWLTQHLALQRYTRLSDLEDKELTRLLRDAEVQARELLATLGHFSPQLRWTRSTANKVHSVPQVQLDVTVGPVAKITEVAWHWQGDAAVNPLAQAQTTDIVRQWALPAGKPFTQAAWSQAKRQALGQLQAQHYPWSRLANSHARVDAETQQVQLSLTLDSGPRVRLGPLQITGADRYGSLQAQRLARLSPGQPYRQTDLLEAQQRLVMSGFYDSVFVSLASDTLAEVTPVMVELKEAPRQKWVMGLGLRSDSGVRVTAEHTHHSVPGLGWRAISKLALDAQLQSAELDLLAPPDASLWRWNTSAKLEREQLTGFQLNSQRWRVGRSQLAERIDRSVYAQYDWAQQVGHIQGQQEAVSGHFAWTWRSFDSLPFPSQGLGWGVELGAGVSLGTPREPYFRWLTKGLFLQPIHERWGRLAWRAELGSVVSQDITALPATQLFLAGGEHSVRGYAPGSIGIPQANGSVMAGRYLGTASLEWQRPITLGAKRSEWESAVFVDVGTVSNDLQQLDTRTGVGVGARWRSPVGPVRIDLAYGQAVRQVRLHLNVGFTF